MIASTSFALLAMLGLAMGSPIEKRATNVVIRSGRTNACLSLPAGTNPSNGAGLVTRDCVSATRWDISPGSGSVVVSGTNFALDAGVPQGNNMPAKVWQSYPGSQQQTWYLTADNRIAVAGGNQCLDQGDNGPQTYQCTNGNTNQVWYVGGAPAPSSTSSASASKTSSTSSSPSSTHNPNHKSAQINFFAQNRCAVLRGRLENGGVVAMEPCNSAVSSQRFDFLDNGLIQYSGTNFCLDAGTNPSNGVALKLWQCYPGLAQQTFAFPQGPGRFRTANNQCLDVDKETLNKLQTWTCSDSDAQQVFDF